MRNFMGLDGVPTARSRKKCSAAPSSECLMWNAVQAVRELLKPQSAQQPASKVIPPGQSTGSVMLARKAWKTWHNLANIKIGEGPDEKFLLARENFTGNSCAAAWHATLAIIIVRRSVEISAVRPAVAPRKRCARFRR